MGGSERYGPFGNMGESVHNRNGKDPSGVTCFCNFCQDEATRRGINVQRGCGRAAAASVPLMGITSPLARSVPLPGNTGLGNNVE